MLSDNETAIAYAHLCEAIDKLNELLNVVEGGFLEVDWLITQELGTHLGAVRTILEP